MRPGGFIPHGSFTLCTTLLPQPSFMQLLQITLSHRQQLQRGTHWCASTAGLNSLMSPYEGRSLHFLYACKKYHLHQGPLRFSCLQLMLSLSFRIEMTLSKTQLMSWVISVSGSTKPLENSLPVAYKSSSQQCIRPGREDSQAPQRYVHAYGNYQGIPKLGTGYTNDGGRMRATQLCAGSPVFICQFRVKFSLLWRRNGTDLQSEASCPPAYLRISRSHLFTPSSFEHMRKSLLGHSYCSRE